MAGMDILCSDKTGTLTKNELVLDGDLIWEVNGSTAGEILKVSCLAAKLEGGQDAIDKAVKEALARAEVVVGALTVCGPYELDVLR